MLNTCTQAVYVCEYTIPISRGIWTMVNAHCAGVDAEIFLLQRLRMSDAVAEGGRLHELIDDLEELYTLSCDPNIHEEHWTAYNALHINPCIGV